MSSRRRLSVIVRFACAVEAGAGWALGAVAEVVQQSLQVRSFSSPTREGLLELGDAVFVGGDLRPEPSHDLLEVFRRGGLSARAGRPRAPSGGTCRRAARSRAGPMPPSGALRAPRSRPSCARPRPRAAPRTRVRVARSPPRGAPVSALLSASLWAWRAAILFSAASFASASLAACVLLRSFSRRSVSALTSRSSFLRLSSRDCREDSSSSRSDSISPCCLSTTAW